jgi:hypothetical protein
MVDIASPNAGETAMDGKLFRGVYHVVMTVDHPNSPEATHGDRAIVLVKLRADANDRSVSWACQKENWAGLPVPPTWPSQPTMSRRLKTPSVQALLAAVEAWVKAQAADEERVRVVDGRALLVHPFSKDKEARWGWAAKGFARGYKLHVLWGNGPMPWTWAVTALSANEPRVARDRLVPGLPAASGKRYLVGDSAYDVNLLYEAVHGRGWQLLAPRKRPNAGLGSRKHHPARLTAIERLRTPYGRRLYAKRATVERQFGNCALRAEGLDQLPAHVRGLERVRQFVHGKLILNGLRILMNRNALRLEAA